MPNNVKLPKPGKPKMSPEVAAALGVSADDVDLSNDAPAPDATTAPPTAAAVTEPPTPAPSAADTPTPTPAPAATDTPPAPPAPAAPVTAPDLTAQLQQAQGALTFAQSELTTARRDLTAAQQAQQSAETRLAAITAERDAALVPMRTAVQAMAVPLNQSVANIDALTLPQLCDTYTTMRAELTKRFPVGGKAKTELNAPVEAPNAPAAGAPNPMNAAAVAATALSGSTRK